MALQLENEYCFYAFRPLIILVVPGVVTMILAYLTLATVTFKLNTYVRKELEEIKEGVYEDVNIDEER